MPDQPTSTPELAAAIRALIWVALFWDYTESPTALDVVARLDEPHRSLVSGILTASPG